MSGIKVTISDALKGSRPIDSALIPPNGVQLTWAEIIREQELGKKMNLRCLFCEHEWEHDNGHFPEHWPYEIFCPECKRLCAIKLAAKKWNDSHKKDFE
jgi:hypothetical protein